MVGFIFTWDDAHCQEKQKEKQAFTGNKKTWREQSRLSGCSWGGGDNAAKIDLAFFMCDIFLLDFHKNDFNSILF